MGTMGTCWGAAVWEEAVWLDGVWVGDTGPAAGGGLPLLFFTRDT